MSSSNLIDLGEVPPLGRPPSDPAGARSPIPWRALLGGLAVLLLALLGGAAHRPRAAAPTIVAARLGDSTFVRGDRLFVVSAGVQPFGAADPTKIVSAYALPEGTLLSRSTAAFAGTVFDVTSVAGTILVSYGVDASGAAATVAVLAGTDRALWRHSAALLAVSAPAGLALLSANSPAGIRSFGVDLATGVIRWSLPAPVFPAPLRDGFPDRVVTADLRGHLEVHDAITGAVTATADVPAPADWRTRGVALWMADDLVLVGGQAGTTAYALSDLSKRWSNAVDLSELYVLPHCADAVCLAGTLRGVQVLDRRTGRQRWSADHWSALEQAGRYLLADGPVGGPGQEPQAVVDPATGRQLGDFGPWRAGGDPRPDGTVIGLRQRAGESVLWYAALDPATLGVRVLGAADGVLGDCTVAARVLVCRRLDASVGIWQLG